MAYSRYSDNSPVPVNPGGQENQRDNAHPPIAREALKLLILVLAASCGIRSQQVVAQPQGANVRALEHISYGIKAPKAQVLNAYLVQRETPTAAIIQILSGGWNSAPPQKAVIEPFKPYLDTGISVIVVAHRPIGKDIHWPVPGNDVARAIQFVRERADDWGIDRNPIVVKGRSSGGHLALMVGFGPDRANPAVRTPSSVTPPGQTASWPAPPRRTWSCRWANS